MAKSELPNSQVIFERLKELDEAEDVEVSHWEAQFIESLFRRPGGLSDKQKAVAMKILEEHGY